MFDLLRAHLKSVPVLGYPDVARPFDLETDASLQGLGVLLSQKMRMAKAGSSHMPADPSSLMNGQCAIAAQIN